MVEIRRNYVWVNGQGIEKRTKTHQMRRIALDAATVEVLTAHHDRYLEIVEKLGEELSDQTFLFSPEPLCVHP